MIFWAALHKFDEQHVPSLKHKVWNIVCTSIETSDAVRRISLPRVHCAFTAWTTAVPIPVNSSKFWIPAALKIDGRQPLSPAVTACVLVARPDNTIFAVVSDPAVFIFFLIKIIIK